MLLKTPRQLSSKVDITANFGSGDDKTGRECGLEMTIILTRMNPDLSVNYLGLKLRTPLVPSASPRSEQVQNVVKMAEAGAAAVVFHSLYSEQCDQEPGSPDQHFKISPDLYCEHIRQAKRETGIPIIGSINVLGTGAWIDAAKQMEDAGVDAIELNIQHFPEVTYKSSLQIENETVGPVYLLKQTVSVPIAVKLTPFYTNLFQLASRLQDAGANGLTLFNRFVQPDLGLPDDLQFSSLPLSNIMDGRLPMHWIAVMAPRLQFSYAASGGIQRAPDVVKMLLVGANITMVCSVLLRRGLTYLAELEQALASWMSERGYTRIEQFQGTMAYSPWSEPGTEERNGYIRMLTKSEHRLDAPSIW